MWPGRVVVLPPPLDEHLGLEQRVKRFPFQQLVSQLPVVAADVIRHPRCGRPSRPLTARRPTGANSCRCTTTAMSFKRRIDFTARDRYPRPLTPAERQATTKPSGGRTRRDSAPTPENCHFREESRRSRSRFWGPRDGSTRLTSLSSVGPCLRKCHWPGDPLGSFSPLGMTDLIAHPSHAG